jgi:FMN-dependent oxidoreductase (nitrilotriacetate monooxygenase family)
VQSDGEFSLAYQTEFARTAEAGLFDCVFMADESSLARPPAETDMLKRLSSVTGFDPLTLMTALAMRTERIGLIFTSSTTYQEPYNLARAIGSLDHISGGRAGWNLVTSANANEAPNFGRDVPVHAERYARAREFYDVVTGLWDSFDDDAFCLDKAAGVYAHPDKMHALDYQGQHYRVRGPLKMGRPPQGYPVIAQAGASEAGRELGARTADVIFCTNHFKAEAQAFYNDIKSRAEQAGRQRGDVKILPGADHLGSQPGRGGRPVCRHQRVVSAGYRHPEHHRRSRDRCQQSGAGFAVSDPAAVQRHSRTSARDYRIRPPRQSHDPPDGPATGRLQQAPYFGRDHENDRG